MLHELVFGYQQGTRTRGGFIYVCCVEEEGRRREAEAAPKWWDFSPFYISSAIFSKYLHPQDWPGETWILTRCEERGNGAKEAEGEGESVEFVVLLCCECQQWELSGPWTGLFLLALSYGFVIWLSFTFLYKGFPFWPSHLPLSCNTVLVLFLVHLSGPFLYSLL